MNMFAIIFSLIQGIQLGVVLFPIDQLKTLHLQLLAFSNVEEAFKIIIWYVRQTNTNCYRLNII